MIFAEGPRQSINALTLYALFLSKKDKGHWYDISTYFNGVSYISAALTISTAFTTFIFALSLLMLIIAGICYIPLLTYIQGNLKVSRSSAMYFASADFVDWTLRNTAATR